MNERIKELALQAGAGEWGDSIVPAMMDVEKFAELIINSVLAEVREEVQYEYDWKLADAVSDRVKKHFGVE